MKANNKHLTRVLQIAKQSVILVVGALLVFVVMFLIISGVDMILSIFLQGIGLVVATMLVGGFLGIFLCALVASYILEIF